MKVAASPRAYVIIGLRRRALARRLFFTCVKCYVLLAAAALVAWLSAGAEAPALQWLFYIAWATMLISAIASGYLAWALCPKCGGPFSRRGWLWLAGLRPDLTATSCQRCGIELPQV